MAAEIAAALCPGSPQYRSDLSTFSALNLDGLAAQSANVHPCAVGLARKLQHHSDLRAAVASKPSSKDPTLGSGTTLTVPGMLDKIARQAAVPKQDTFAAVRDLFMRFRACGKNSMEVPRELKTLFVSEVALPQPRALPKPCADRTAPGIMRQVSLDSYARQVSLDSYTRQVSLDTCAETVYTPGMARQLSLESRSDAATIPFALMRSISGGPLDELRRKVQSLLNKVCPENITTIAEQISSIQVTRLSELEVIIELIFRKSLNEPHYTETYADLIFCLKSAFPEFPGDGGRRPMTFRSSLLNVCQKEFEASLVPSEGDQQPAHNAEELELEKKQHKDRMLANMKLIGHLFLRQLLPAKVIATILQELIPCGEGDCIPEEHAMECACELLMSTGHALESIRGGTPVVQQIMGRLRELKQMRGPEGKSLCNKRVQFLILDLCDARSEGWTKRTFKSSAKTKDEVRMEQQRQKSAQTRGAGPELAERVVVGQRPQYILIAMGA